MHRSTYQLLLQILSLPPLQLQTQSENIQLQNIPSIPVPATRVEPVLQPPRVKIIQSAPTPPPRLQPSTSPSFDTNINPWIKNLQNVWSHLSSPKPGKHRRHLCKFYTVYAATRATLEKLSAPKQLSTLSPTISTTYHILSTSTMIRGKSRLFTSYYWENIVTLGGKLLGMNLEDLTMGFTTKCGEPTQ